MCADKVKGQIIFQADVTEEERKIIIKHLAAAFADVAAPSFSGNIVNKYLNGHCDYTSSNKIEESDFAENVNCIELVARSEPGNTFATMKLFSRDDKARLGFEMPQKLYNILEDRINKSSHLNGKVRLAPN